VDFQADLDELYGLTPQEFTPARDAKAAAARNSGDRELAAAIKQLRRPSQAAWLANLLARERPHRVDELLDLGERLRNAQRRLAGEELKELARQGHRVVVDLVRDAERLAVSAGQSPGPASLRQLQETLDAALADSESGRALRAGRLAAALSYAGLGAVADDARVTTGADRERIAVEEALAELHAGERRVAELTAELQSAHRRRERLREQREEVEHQLAQARAQESDVDRSIEELEAAIAAATGEMESARSRVRRSASQA
jgi:chromosome segregation ATPase